MLDYFERMKKADDTAEEAAGAPAEGSESGEGTEAAEESAPPAIQASDVGALAKEATDFKGTDEHVKEARNGELKVFRSNATH